MLEWNTWRAMTMLDGGTIKANLKFDDNGVPMSTAQGNMADIFCDYEEYGLTVEVTTAGGQKQYEMESEPVSRHLAKYIIYQTTEDDADDTIVPRFNSAGGNGDNLIFIKEDMKSLSFGNNRICEAIEKYNAKLLILDPMSSYIGESCSMNNANETQARV